MGWAGFDVPWSNTSHNTEMSPLQTGTQEGHISQGIIAGKQPPSCVSEKG